MKITRLKVNHLTNPLGFDLDYPVFSYTVTQTAGKKQACARILVSKTGDFSTLCFDSGVRGDIDCAAFALPIQLEPRTRYYWKVWAQADNGESAQSEPAWFETAKRKGEKWAGQFITQPFSQDVHPVYRKKITLNKAADQARIYVLGLGVYELYVNGKKQGDECLLPGIHAYEKWLQYQTFALDLTQGENVLEIRLGNGWYKGRFSIARQKANPDAKFCCIAEIRIQYEDGSEEVIGTDESWRAVRGQVTMDSIYDGEVCDATVAEGAETPVVPLYSVAPSLRETVNEAMLCPRLSPPIKIQERLKPELIVTPKGETVLDMKQNMVGWLEFKADLPAGTKIFMQFGEILQDDCFYRENLRSAKCEFTYISGGKPELVRQHYTFYGFRYVKVEGFPGQISPEDFTGCVIHSEMEEIGFLETSDSRLNRLFANAWWGQKGNFLDTATDCPQRNERMGWTGDAQIFADTACFNMDTYAFYTKYLHDLWLEQKALGGSVPYTVPTQRYTLNGSTAWGEAATVIPWTVYLHYGDASILARQYESMKAWVEYMRRDDRAAGNRHLWTRGWHFGDWLALDGKVSGGVYGATDTYLIASAYYYYSTLLTAKAAAVLGKEPDAREYAALAGQIREAFIKEYYTDTGRLAVNTQTAYAMVHFMNLIPEEARERTSRDMRDKLRENSFVLETGFVGTPYLCPALAIGNNRDAAYKLLFREDFPGWLYEVKMGATTVWERWNSVLPNGRISGTAMNSLNHYAYGSIVGWMYRDVLGINPVEEAPGFKKARIEPKPDCRLRSMKGSLNTPYGKYEIAWELEETRLNVTVTVPFGCEAKLFFADVAGKDSVRPCGETAYSLRQEGEEIYALLSAGTHRFTAVPETAYRQRFSLDNTVDELLNDERSKALIFKHFPDFAHGIPFQKESKSMKEIVCSPFSVYDEKVVEEFEKELARL